ncbi:hypothetical protein COCON_G00029000 [Conger conger]|uniref:Suppressor of cytokine signaling 1 n=1 Tax=Conger conger TaxID=82655 RepID=A0A9Q1DY87_CONCO|nr:suppressor of cytokine signaling 1b [Conger conger]XP_061088193.1 suppressor of cytokine signaling 1b [Conger conger]KAJ8284050.1 hypothetical protein COCON_G00029000 [Conger conger]
MVAHSEVGNASATDNRARIELAPDTLPHQHRQLRKAAPSTEIQTRFRPFRNQKDFQIITKTTSMLETCGFYWGPMTVEEAHSILKEEPLGTFLIRDSRQKDIFFTLSYRDVNGPISVRIDFQNSRFSLVGSNESFDSLFKLLEHYIASPKKNFVRPYRKVKVQSLQELCRKRIIETCAGEKIDSLPVTSIMKDFLNAFPYRI